MQLFSLLLFLLGVADLSKGYESRYLCPSQPEGVQRAPCFPAGQRWVSQSAGNGVSDHPLRPWRPDLPRWRKCGQPLLCGVGITGGHSGWRGGGHFRWVNKSWFMSLHQTTLSNLTKLIIEFNTDVYFMTESVKTCRSPNCRRTCPRSAQVFRFSHFMQL